jgi:hypothetical protein
MHVPVAPHPALSANAQTRPPEQSLADLQPTLASPPVELSDEEHATAMAAAGRRRARTLKKLFMAAAL